MFVDINLEIGLCPGWIIWGQEPSLHYQYRGTGMNSDSKLMACTGVNQSEYH